MSQCPCCHDTKNQVEAGKNGSGSQHYKCKPCGRRYNPEPSQMYGDDLRQKAIEKKIFLDKKTS